MSSTRKIRFWKTVCNYWFDENTNVFHNYIDAILGMIVLVVFPAISIVNVFLSSAVGFSDYFFPIFSIAFAGMYDAYGRWSNEKGRGKLVLRLAVDSLAIVTSALLMHVENKIVWALPPFFLFLVGVTLCVEVYNRVKTALEISEWSIWSA